MSCHGGARVGWEVRASVTERHILGVLKLGKNCHVSFEWPTKSFFTIKFLEEEGMKWRRKRM